LASGLAAVKFERRHLGVGHHINKGYPRFTARNDLEATKLWHQLDELKDLAGIYTRK
jgi:hypothetical protein